jgi:hypothetical protein
MIRVWHRMRHLKVSLDGARPISGQKARFSCARRMAWPLLIDGSMRGDQFGWAGALAAMLFGSSCGGDAHDAGDGSATTASDASDVPTDGTGNPADASFERTDEPTGPAGDGGSTERDGTSDERDAPNDASDHERETTGPDGHTDAIDVRDDEAETAGADVGHDDATDVPHESGDIFTDASDATTCPSVIRWFGPPFSQTPACSGTTCPNDQLCIPGCAVRQRMKTVPCGESVCQADELCTTERPGVDSGQPIVPRCVAGPERFCSPGRDCCYPSCQAWSGGAVDLEQRTQDCFGI